MKEIDERFYDAKPKKKAGKKSKTKHYYYQLDQVGMYPGLYCVNCSIEIAGQKAVQFAGGFVPGPFCRVDCAAQYNNIKKGVWKLGNAEDDLD